MGWIAAAARKTRHMSKMEELACLRDQYRDGLLDNVLPFWLPTSVDEVNGGYWTSRAADGTIVDTDKSMWAQGRFSWLLSKLACCVSAEHVSLAQRDQWLAAAAAGLRFIDQNGVDPADGRMWFHVSSSGKPIRKRRYAFSESFASIAYAQYAKAADCSVSAAKAIGAFEQFMAHQPPAKFETGGKKIGIGQPMIAIATSHELREAIDWKPATEIIAAQIEVIERIFVCPDLEVVLEIAAPDGSVIDHFDGRTLNPGHAIEAAWFIIREGTYSANSAWIQLGLQMLDWMLERGWDRQFGGLLYFTSLDDRPIQEYWQDMKFWWPHNEAIIATLYAATLTGDAKYWTWHRRIHDWAHRHFADPVHGEWFGYLRRDGAVSNPLKGNLWKGPFHLPRMQLVCWQLLDAYLEQDAAQEETLLN